jgi:hypothetical protein
VGAADGVVRVGEGDGTAVSVAAVVTVTGTVGLADGDAVTASDALSFFAGPATVPMMNSSTSTPTTPPADHRAIRFRLDIPRPGGSGGGEPHDGPDCCCDMAPPVLVEAGSIAGVPAGSGQSCRVVTKMIEPIGNGQK